MSGLTALEPTVSIVKFFEKHGAPTLHNAVGGLITVGVIGLFGLLVAFLEPLRRAVLAFLSWAVPLWLALLMVLIIGTPLLVMLRSSRRKLAATARRLTVCAPCMMACQSDVLLEDAPMDKSIVICFSSSRMVRRFLLQRET